MANTNPAPLGAILSSLRSVKAQLRGTEWVAANLPWSPFWVFNDAHLPAQEGPPDDRKGSVKRSGG